MMTLDKSNVLRPVVICFLHCLLLASCGKEREASFTVEKSTVYLGEGVRVDPEYTNVDNYRWDYGDNSDVIEEEHPQPHVYEAEGTYTITLTASHRKNMRRSVQHTQKVNVISWTIDSMRINSIPDFDSWDSPSNGPDIKMKINDPNNTFTDLFISDYIAYFPFNIDTLPVSATNLGIKLYYANWDFRLLEDDLPLPNVQMYTWTSNPYTLGSGGIFKLSGAGYDIDVYYKVNQ